jgi:glycosyltransferase involved in cell wall biosynthesis
MPEDRPRSLLALPVHGEAKLRVEGLRTRDAHLLEWISKLRPDLDVRLRSRPEPWPRVTLARARGEALPSRWRCESPEPLTLPPLRDRRRWWTTSLRFADAWPASIDGAIVWNPVTPRPPGPAAVPIVFDLLDNWLIHPSFESIRGAVESGYSEWLALASGVTANSEATLALARAHGREDAVLLPNGCDPERFSSRHTPGRRLTIGYGGKISTRLDTELVVECAESMPEVRFEFAGPVMVRGLRRRLASLPNVDLIGDVPYGRYPDVLSNWDVAWAPHRVGDGEVGGDAIKLYEYRAAGLPTVTTKIIGWQRAAAGVVAVDRGEVLPTLRGLCAGGPGSLGRDDPDLSPDQTWRVKAEKILGLLEL